MKKNIALEYRKRIFDLKIITLPEKKLKKLKQKQISKI